MFFLNTFVVNASWVIHLTSLCVQLQSRGWDGGKDREGLPAVDGVKSVSRSMQIIITKRYGYVEEMCCIVGKGINIQEHGPLVRVFVSLLMHVTGKQCVCVCNCCHLEGAITLALYLCVYGCCFLLSSVRLDCQSIHIGKAA